MNRVILSVSAWVLAAAGCQSTAVRDDPASPAYVIPVNSAFVLEQDVTMPPETAHVYIQNGAIRPLRATALYEPNCKLRVADVRQVARAIHSDTFRIVEVTRYVSDVMLVDRGPLRVAAADRLAGMDDGVSDTMYVTEMRLRSEAQPEVVKLICQQTDDPGLGQHVTVDEMRRTLQPLARLKLPDGA